MSTNPFTTITEFYQASRTSKVTGDVFRYVIGKAIPGVAGLLSVVVFFRLVGPEEYGLFSLAFSSVAVVSALAFSWINQGQLRYSGTKEYDAEDFFKTLGRAWMLAGLAGLSLLTALLALKLPLASQILAILFLLAMGMHLIRITGFQANLQASSVVRLEAVRSVAAILIPLLAFLLFGKNHAALLAGVAASFAAALLPTSPWGRQPVRLFHPLNAKQKKLLSLMWNYGWPMSLWLSSMAMFPALDRYLIQHFHGNELTGTYASIFDLVTRSYSLFLFPVTMALHPRIMVAWNNNEHEKAAKLLKAGMAVQFAIFLVVATSFSLLAPQILSLLFEEGAAAHAGLIPLLTIGGFFWQVSLLAHKPLEMRKRTFVMLSNIVIALILHGTVQVLLLPKFGISAAPVAYTCSGFCYLALSVLSCRFRLDQARLSILTLTMVGLLLQPAALQAENSPWQQGAAIPLGKAYAASSINVSVFRQAAILTTPAGQFSSFFDPDGRVLIYRTTKPAEAQLIATILPSLNQHLLGNGHCSINMGYSADGTLHVLYGAHATRPWYARLDLKNLAALPNEVKAQSWPEEQITYPQFYPHGNGISLWFRQKKSIFMVPYDQKSGQWQWQAKTSLLAADSGVASVYMDRLAVRGDRQGLAWVYRLPSKAEQPIRNQGLYFLLSEDAGRTWQDRNSTLRSLPIKRQTAPLLTPVDPEQERINQCSSAFGPDGEIYITALRLDHKGIPQIFVRRFFKDRVGGMELVVSQNQQEFHLQGKGTLVLPFSRPELAVSQKWLHVIYRYNSQLILASIDRQRFDSAPWQYFSPATLPALGAWEPNYDLESWDKEQRLFLYIQGGVAQGASDKAVNTPPTDAWLYEFIESD